MAKLRAALTGMALTALTLTAATPAFAARTGRADHALRVVGSAGGAGGAGKASTGQRGAGQVTALIATDSSTVAPSALSLDPPTTRRGGVVDLRTFATCDGSNTGTVGSPALAAPVELAPAADGGLFAEAHVAKDTRPGSYRVVDLCGSKVVAVGTLKVVDPGAPAAGGGWGATRFGAAVPAGPLLGGVRSTGALALTGTAALAGLVLLQRRLRGVARG